jgi:hypothetical protein
MGYAANNTCGAFKGGFYCPLGQCCSMYGYCSTSASHCELINGCQPAYGNCTTTTLQDQALKWQVLPPKAFVALTELLCISKMLQQSWLLRRNNRMPRSGLPSSIWAL